MGTPFFHKLGHKIVIFRGFTVLAKFFQNYWIPIKVFNIEFPTILCWKPAKKSNWVWS